MPVGPALPLSEDAQCAWEAGGREALTYGTGANGPVCLMIGLLELREGPAAAALREHTNLTAERMRTVLGEWQPAREERLLNLAIVRDRAQALALRRNEATVAAEDLLLALVEAENEGTRLHQVMERASPSLDMATLRDAVASTGETAANKAA